MEACNRPGCSGTIEDGYCDVCGLAPVAAAVAAGGSPGAAVGSTTAASARSGRTASTRSARSTRSGSSRGSSRRAFGGGIVARPPLPPQDPVAALVPGEVPDRKRYCSNCEAKLSREAGFCPTCGQEYSFVPSLKPGDVAAGKYEVKGTLAFGGLGWIYLAFDTVLSRWVVLKGLLNSKDPNMLALAVKEREFLAAVKHRAIVGIYDFITAGTEGFIVMEYVNGKTLMTLRKEHEGPLPVTEAISYILEVLPAFAYLAEHGMVYCDFKPENAMVEGEDVKLIDMGAVRREDDEEGDIYGTKGYAAPEANDTPSPLSDLYTVARTLAVLVADFDFQGRYEHTLPPPDAVPAFREHESLYRFLTKATRADPDARFQTAEEMGQQLLGVLREAAADTQDLGRLESPWFADDDFTVTVDEGDGQTRAELPTLKVDAEDPAASVILAAAAVAEPAKRYALFERAIATYPGSVELQLRMVGELVAMNDFDGAEHRLADLADGGDWRLDWYRGRLLLGQGKAREAIAAFQAVYDELPGELGPKLALGHAYTLAGDLDRAIHYYDLVSRTDPIVTGAAFGLARCLAQRGDRAGAVAAYERVPGSSNRYTSALLALAQVLLDADGARPGVDELTRAAAAVEALAGTLDGLPLHQLSAHLLCTAAELVEARTAQPSASSQVLGVPLQAFHLRLAAERELRACARFATDPAAKIRFVDEANRVRPLTLV